MFILKHIYLQQIWLPGDNDIGGENEPIRKAKVSEFNAVFEQPSVIGYRNISFYRVNAITYSIPLRPDVEDLNYRMAVSHYPIVSKGIYGRQVIFCFLLLRKEDSRSI